MRKALAVLLSVAFVVALVIAQDKTTPTEKQDVKKVEKVEKVEKAQAAGCCGMEKAAKKQSCPDGQEACKDGKECCKKGMAAGKSCCAEKMNTKTAKPGDVAPKK